MLSVRDVLGSDYLLAALIPLVLFVLSLQVLGSPKDVLYIIFGSHRTQTTPGHFSVQRAAASYAQYTRLALSELATMRKSYERMRWSHRRIGYDLGYTIKLARLEESIRTNAVVADAIARLAEDVFPEEFAEQESSALRPAITGDLGRVRESMKHFVRDWSEEGRVERGKIFGPILEVLKTVEPREREHMKVLVPGSGLGRLAWEITQLGEYHVTMESCPRRDYQWKDSTRLQTNSRTS